VQFTSKMEVSFLCFVVVGHRVEPAERRKSHTDQRFCIEPCPYRIDCIEQEPCAMFWRVTPVTAGATVNSAIQELLKEVTITREDLDTIEFRTDCVFRSSREVGGDGFNLLIQDRARRRNRHLVWFSFIVSGKHVEVCRSFGGWAEWFSLSW